MLWSLWKIKSTTLSICQTQDLRLHIHLFHFILPSTSYKEGIIVPTFYTPGNWDLETLSGPPEMTQRAERELDSVCKPVTLSRFPSPCQPREGKHRDGQMNSKVIVLPGVLSPPKRAGDLWVEQEAKLTDLDDQLNRCHMTSISAVIVANTKITHYLPGSVLSTFCALFNLMFTITL